MAPICCSAQSCSSSTSSAGRTSTPKVVARQPRPLPLNPVALRITALAPMPAILATVATILSTSQAHAAGAPELFTTKCAGCHMNGGNVLAVGATLFPEDLKRNGVDSSEALYKLIYGGKGKMPGFGKDCAPKGACTFGPRLSDEDVAGLAAYVQERAVAGWKQQ